MDIQDKFKMAELFLLTDDFIRSIVFPKGRKKITYTSSQSKGLTLVVHKTSKQLHYNWHFRYIAPDSRRTSLKIGAWPHLDETAALEQTRQFHDLLNRGIDPVTYRNKRRADKGESIINQASLIEPKFRFHLLAEKWLSHCEAVLKEGSVKKYRSSYKTYLFPQYGHIDIRHLDLTEYEEYIVNIPTRSAAANAHRAMRALYSYAVKLKILQANPLYGLKEITKKTKVEPNTKFFTSEEVHKFLNELNKQNISEDAKIALLLELYLGLRISEILAIKWQDIDFRAKTIKHNGHIMKNGKKAVTIMPDQVRRILLEWKRDSPHQDSDRVFMEGLNTARITDEMKKLKSWMNFGTHTLRKTTRTYLQYLGCPEEIRRTITNHSEPAGVAAHYDLARLDQAQLHWLTIWAKKLEEAKKDKTVLHFGIEADEDDQLLQEFKDLL